MRKAVSGVGRGFTIIELMVVVVVISIMTSIAIPNFMKFSARAYRTEMLNTVANIKAHLKTVHEAKGTFLPDGASLPFETAPNPALGVPMGQPAAWSGSASGWTDFPYPPDGAVRMRYWYTVQTADLVTITACASFPGMGPNGKFCPSGAMGNYKYWEDVNGDGSSSTFEDPEF